MNNSSRVVDLFAPLEDPDNCYENAYAALPTRQSSSLDHINRNASVNTEDTIDFGPAPVTVNNVPMPRLKKKVTWVDDGVSTRSLAGSSHSMEQSFGMKSSVPAVSKVPQPQPSSNQGPKMIPAPKPTSFSPVNTFSQVPTVQPNQIQNVSTFPVPMNHISSLSSENPFFYKPVAQKVTFTAPEARTNSKNMSQCQSSPYNNSSSETVEKIRRTRDPDWINQHAAERLKQEKLYHVANLKTIHPGGARNEPTELKPNTAATIGSLENTSHEPPPFRCSLPAFSDKTQSSQSKCKSGSSREVEHNSAVGTAVIKQTEDRLNPKSTVEIVAGATVKKEGLQTISTESMGELSVRKLQTSKTLFVGTSEDTSGIQSDDEFFKEMLSGRVFVSDKSVPTYKNLADFPLLPLVQRGLNCLGIESTNSLQNHVIPCIMRGRNCFIINRNIGNSLSYMIPIVASVMSQLEAEGNSVRVGPVAVFLVGGLPSGDKLKDALDSLLESSNVKTTIGYFVTQNDRRTKKDLHYGIDIMITTPECLLQMMNEYIEYFNLNRLRYLVLDDTDILMTVKMDTVEKVISQMQHGLTVMAPREVPFQLIFCGSKWMPQLEAAYCNVVSRPVAILGPFQAIKYANVKTLVNFSSCKDRLEQMLDYLRKTAKEYNKVVVVCKDSDSVAEVKSSIVKENWPVQTVTHCEQDRDDVTAPNIEAVRVWWKQSYSSAQVQIIVCTDCVLKELLIVDATNLVNYQVLNSSDQFGGRFSVMWKWFRGPGQEKTNTRKVISSVFLTREEKGRNLLRLVQDLKEIGASIPPDLEAYHEQLKSENERSARLCSGIVYYGVCDAFDPATCLNRHYPLPKDIGIHPLIPKTGEVEVIITKCNNVSSYFARLIRHYQVNGNTRKMNLNYENELRGRHDELTSFYKMKENQKRPTGIKINDTVAIEADGIFIRAVIEDILTKDYTGRPNSIRLFGIDTAEFVMRNVNEDHIYVLPSKFRNLSKFAIELVLANMKPVLGESTYRREHNTKASHATVTKILRGRICLSLGNRIWVDQLVEDGTNRQVRSVRLDYFKKIKIAEPNPQHIKILYDMCKDNGYSCQEYDSLYTKSLDPGFENEFHQMGDDDLRWAHIELSTEKKPISTALLVSFVKTVDLIFCYQEKFIPQLDKMNADLDEEISIYQERVKGDVSHVELLRIKYYECGLVVAAREPLENDGGSPEQRWVRGIIYDIFEDGKDTTYSIFYVDTGDFSTVNLSEISPIPKKFVHCLPAQAILIKLCHVKPNNQNGDQWNNDAINYLYDCLIPDGYSQSINVVALSKEKIHSNLGPHTSYSSYIFIDGDELGQSLVQQNFAVYQDSAGEHQVTTIRAALLKDLNDRVDALIGQGGNSDDEDDDGSESNDNDSLAGDFDTYVADDFLHDLLDIPSSRSSIDSSPCPSNGDSTQEVIQNVEIQPVPSRLQRLYPHIKTPHVEWWNQEQQIILRVMIPDVKEYKITIAADKRTLTFMTSDPPDYGFEVELFKRVEHTILVEPLGQFCKIILTKRLRELMWDTLTSGDNTYKWIKHNLNKISPTADDDNTSNLPPIISCKRSELAQPNYVRKLIKHNHDEDEDEEYDSDCDSIDSNIDFS